MRVGLIGRAEDRGLGNLTREFARHLDPERVLLVRPTAAIDAGLAWHPEWFEHEGLTSQIWSGLLDERKTRRWLDGLDVVYSAETFYDWRMCEWARDAGVRTVCHVMPEYFKHATVDLPAPDVWWAPTRYRLDKLPKGTRVVEVPIALDRFTVHESCIEGSVRWLHVAGARAQADRNGTLVFLEALKHLKREHDVTIRTQSERLYANGSIGADVHLKLATTDLTDYWDLYADADALVLPRRYGGLCLPALEGIGAGLALIMSDVEPQHSEWPIVPLDAPIAHSLTTSAGMIPVAAPDPRALASLMDNAARSPGVIRRAQQASAEFAQAHSWSARMPSILSALEDACA